MAELTPEQRQRIEQFTPSIDWCAREGGAPDPRTAYLQCPVCAASNFAPHADDCFVAAALSILAVHDALVVQLAQVTAERDEWKRAHGFQCRETDAKYDDLMQCAEWLSEARQRIAQLEAEHIPREDRERALVEHQLATDVWHSQGVTGTIEARALSAQHRAEARRLLKLEEK